MEMKKFDLRLKHETVEAIQELADKKYYGNRSLCARDLLEKAIHGLFKTELGCNNDDFMRNKKSALIKFTDVNGNEWALLKQFDDSDINKTEKIEAIQRVLISLSNEL